VELRRLGTIPGIKIGDAEPIIAEVGVNTNMLSGDRHSSLRAGICPGNSESDGRRKRFMTTDGSK